SSQSQAMFIFGASGSFILDGKIDANGQITQVLHQDQQTGHAGFPTQTGGSVRSIAADPKGRFAYTVDVATSSFGNQIGKSGISEYVLDRNTGELNPVEVEGVPIIFDNDRITQIVCEPSGRFDYMVISCPSSDVNGSWDYSSDQKSGALSLVSDSPFGKDSAFLLAVSPRSKFVSNAGNGSIASYWLDRGRPVPAGKVLPGG